MKSSLGLVVLTLASCQVSQNKPATSLADSNLFGKNARNVENEIGEPAEVKIVEPGGPFFETTQVMSYYTEDSEGVVRRQDYWIGKRGVYVAPNWRAGERILSPHVSADLKKIEQFRSNERQAQSGPRE